jgi:ATP-dependent helicase YprA (DUF1998 family)
MTQGSPTTDHGVHTTAFRLTESLRSYIEAQYHIRNESLIRERRRLLEEPSAVSQRPFVESTPVYELDTPYLELSIPAPVKNVLTRLSELDVGIFSRPYVHQAAALEAFFTRQRDLIVATGTGSGKTESFLMPIIGQLTIEANARPQCAAKRVLLPTRLHMFFRGLPALFACVNPRCEHVREPSRRTSTYSVALHLVCKHPRDQKLTLPYCR